MVTGSEIAADIELHGAHMVVGEFAPQLYDFAEIRTAPLQPGLSNDDHPIEKLHPDYITVCRSPFWIGWWRTHYPDLKYKYRPFSTVQLGGHEQYVVDIYRVKSNAH